jgi:hypothetical protein
LAGDSSTGMCDLEIDGYENSSLFHIFCSKIEALERFA